MTVRNRKVDTTRGFDILRGSKVVKHYDSYAEARAHIAAKGGTIRYWVVTDPKGEE